MGGRVRQTLKRFLDSVGEAESATLGGKQKTDDEGTTAVLEDARERLRKELGEQRKKNERIVVAVVSMYVVVFCVATILVIGGQGKTIPSAGVGAYTTLFVAAYRLQRVWVEKNLLDVLMTVIVVLPAKEVVRVVEKLYYAELTNRRTGIGRRRSSDIKGPTAGTLR